MNIKNSPGVYKVQNNVNSTIYIGSSIKVSNRIKQHLRDLRSNRHPNDKFQKNWNKYGEESFEFSILEYVDDVKFLLEREQYYLDTILHADIDDEVFENIGLNLTRRAENNLGYKLSEESKFKMSLAKAVKSTRLYYIDFTNINPEYTCEITENFKSVDENNPFFGKKHTETTKEVMSSKKLGKLNPWFGKKGCFSGKKHSEETKYKMRMSHSGSNNTNSKKVLQYDLFGFLIKEWNSTGEVGRELKISQGNISSCCLGKQKTAYGYIWKYKDSCQ